MSFGENLQFYRKKINITQEQLAEKLEVSRKSVSKWESNTTYPEMDKLLQMCELFSCTMDVLLRGNAEESCCEDTSDYDRRMNNFSRAIAAGIACFFLGVTLLLVLRAAAVSQTLTIMGLLAFVIVGIMIFITTGMNHDAYTKRHPMIKPFYPEEDIARFEKRFSVIISPSIGLLLLGVMWMVGSRALALPDGYGRTLYVAIFIAILGLATTAMTYAGMQKDKYDIEKYNQTNAIATPDSKPTEDPIVGKICGSLFMISITVYLILGFVWNLWAKAWVVFPIFIMLCAVSSILFGKKTK